MRVLEFTIYKNLLKRSFAYFGLFWIFAWVCVQQYKLGDQSQKRAWEWPGAAV